MRTERAAGARWWPGNGCGWRLWLTAVLGLLIAACALQLDEPQARACRAVIPALHEENARIAIMRIATLDTPNVLRIDYRARGETGPERGHFLICGFAASGLGQNRTDIVALRNERGTIGGASLYFLKRFWLETADAELQLPPALARPPLFGTGSAAAAAALQHAAAAAPLMAITALLASAYALIYGLIGRVLLLFGEFSLLGAAATAFGVAAAEFFGVTAPALLLAAGLLVCLWSAGWVGGVTARAVFLPIMRRPGQHVLIVSIGLAIVLAEAVRLAQGSGRRWLSPVWSEPLPLLRAPEFTATITPSATGVTLLALAAGALLLIGMRRSPFGRMWRAASDDMLAAEFMGVDPARVAMRSFMLAAGLAAFAGFLLSVHLGGMGYSGGAVFGLKALVGAILGGIGSVGGAWLGGLCIGLFEALWSAYFPIEWRDVAVFALLAALLIWRPGGFFGFGDVSPRRV